MISVHSHDLICSVQKPDVRSHASGVIIGDDDDDDYYLLFEYVIDIQYWLSHPRGKCEHEG